MKTFLLVLVILLIAASQPWHLLPKEYTLEPPQTFEDIPELRREAVALRDLLDNSLTNRQEASNDDCCIDIVITGE